MAQEQAHQQSQDGALEAVLQDLAAAMGPEAVAGLQQAVIHDVELRVSAKSEELWKKGRAMLDKYQKKHCEEHDRLASQVLECNARAASLEAENAKLRRAVEELSGRLAEIFGSGSAPLAAPAAEVDASHGNGLVALPPGFESLPYVPPFPDCGAKAPLLLSESLTSSHVLTAAESAQPKMPLTLSDSITPPVTPCVHKGPFVFSFTLRKADGVSLGLNISHSEDDNSLLVEDVRPDGAVGAWNRLCAGGPTAEKAVRSGDKITDVNGISKDLKGMLDECRDRATVKLTMVRGNAPLPVMTLRAEAAAFVPGASPVVGPAADPEPTLKAATTPAPEVTPEADKCQ